MKNNNKKITTYFVIFSLLLIGIVYAILQANLQINGIAKIKSNSWDIHFDNIVINENSVTIGTGDTQATIDPNNNCKVDFEVTLSLPGDFYEFTVDIINNGTIDGMIGELNKTLKVNNETVSEVPDYLEYSVTYEDGMEILQNHALNAGTTETYKVRLEFKTDIEELPDATTITMSLDPQYIQADDTAIERPVAMFLDGKSFNAKIKKLAGNSSATYSSADSNITAFRRSSAAPDISLVTENNIVSVSSENPIYSWFDDGTIYYYSSNGIYLNEDASYMFNEMRNLSSIELDTIKTKKTINMSYMFSYAGYNVTAFNIDLSNWNTSQVITMSHMFYHAGRYATTFNLNLSNWNTSNVQRMDGMFSESGYASTIWNITDLTNWDTSQTIFMYDMFHNAGSNAAIWSIGDVSNWDTSKVTNMSGMFSGTGDNATTWNIGDLSNWDTSQVSSMFSMFSYSGYNATTWSIGDLSNWDTSKVTSMYNMFSHSGYNATTWSIGDLSNWDTSKVTSMARMFDNAGYNATTWNIGDLSNWDTSKVTSMSNMFYYAGYSAETWNSIGALKIYATSIDSMFQYCRNAKGTLKIYNNPTSYSSAFGFASTISGSGITVDYTSAVTNIDNIIATKSSSSNVVKGSLFTP